MPSGNLNPHPQKTSDIWEKFGYIPLEVQSLLKHTETSLIKVRSALILAAIMWVAVKRRSRPLGAF